MTLNTRNKLLLSFSIISSVCACIFIATLVRAFMQGTETTAKLLYLPQVESFYLLFFVPNHAAAFFSLLVFSLFVPAAGFSVYFNFEKTQSLEVLFFCSALIGILSESFRLCIPLFGLTAGYSVFLRFIGQAAFFGQIEMLLTIIMQATIAAGAGSRESDKYLGIIIIIALILSTAVPLNTTVLESYISVSYGFENLFSLIRFIFTFCTFFTLFLSPKGRESLDYKKASLDFLFICCGYIALSACTNFARLGIGTVLLIAGTAGFLQNMHRYYMWK